MKKQQELYNTQQKNLSNYSQQQNNNTSLPVRNKISSMNSQQRVLYVQQLHAQQNQQQQQQRQQLPQMQQAQIPLISQPNQLSVPKPQVQTQSQPQAQPYQLNSTQPMRVASNDFFTIAPYRIRKDQGRISVITKYDVMGYIAAGTYGKVYKAKGKLEFNKDKLFAIKKFKSDSKDNEVMHYTGISQSAIREMSLCKEINHKNISKLTEIVLERKCIYMVFEFAEHDLLQIIHHHSHPEIKPISQLTLKSAIFQILQGLTFLHQNWILHRDLKPANIMVTNDGIIKIGDLGLARKFNNPLQSLYAGDKVVVTIWYRAPELLLGARHYTPAIDLWAVGCILAELLSLRPLFKGEETKMDNKKHMPFQENQLLKILEILGTPKLDKWQSLSNYPEFHQLSRFTLFPSNLKAWYANNGGQNKNCLKLLSELLEYDPSKRVNALDSMNHAWFSEDPKPLQNIFENSNMKYPRRKIHKDDTDILGGSNNSIYGNQNFNNYNNQKRNFALMNGGGADASKGYDDKSKRRIR